jgi:hypothetical protein
MTARESCVSLIISICSGNRSSYTFTRIIVGDSGAGVGDCVLFTPQSTTITLTAVLEQCR